MPRQKSAYQTASLFIHIVPAVFTKQGQTQDRYETPTPNATPSAYRWCSHRICIRFSDRIQVTVIKSHPSTTVCFNDAYFWMPGWTLHCADQLSFLKLYLLIHLILSFQHFSESHVEIPACVFLRQLCELYLVRFCKFPKCPRICHHAHLRSFASRLIACPLGNLGP